MTEEEKEIRRVLQAVADKGSYELGHVKWIQGIAERKRKDLQDELISLLGIRECECDH